MGERDRREVQQITLVMARLNQVMSEAAKAAVRDPDLAAGLPVTLMFALDVDGPMRPTGIGELTGLSSGGVTKLVERLEGKGLVTRTTGAVDDDRRGVVVELTRRGRSAVRSIADAMVNARRDADDLTTDLAGLLAT